MTKVVEPEGPKDAKIVILGEAPGEEEDREGRPFIGPSGRMLFDSILARAGIRRSECLILNTHWTLPPGKKWETIPKEERGIWDLPTLTAIKEHPRQAVVAVGDHALDFCLHGTSDVQESAQVTKWRGSILTETSLPYRVIPMIHPAAVLRSSGYNEADADDDGTGRGSLHYQAVCVHDAKRIRQVADDPALLPPRRSVLHAGNTRWTDLMASMKSFDHHPEKPIAFDIETYAHSVTCLGLAMMDSTAIVVPFTQVDGWSEKQRTELVQEAARVLDGPNPKIGQNLDYDVQHLARMNIPVRNVWLDTAVAHSILYPEMPHDLAMLTSLYTLQPFFKDMRKQVEKADYSDAQWTYNGLDCCVTWEIGMKLWWEMYHG